MITQREQQINDMLTELQVDIANKITAKGGAITGNTLFELSNAIETIPTGGGKDIGGMIPKIATSQPKINLQAPITPTVTNNFNIPFGVGITFGTTENIQISLGGTA